MQKWISILSGLLVVQLVLAVTMNLTGEEYGAFEAEERLLAFDEVSVDGLRIDESELSLLLKKQEDQWVLPEHGGFPAGQNSVKQLLDKLAGLEKGWPVATTSGAAQRFKVAEEQFERKLSLSADEEILAQLYVGTSPGFRKVHVRPEAEDAVYAVAFNTWEASAKADDWIDKQILKFDESSVERIEMPGYVLQRESEALLVMGLGDQEEASVDEISALLSSLTSLTIQSLLGAEAKPEYQQDEPELEIKLARTEGDPLTYRFSKPEEGADYVLKRSDLEHYFKITEYAVKPILEATREKLVQSKAEPEGRAEEAVSETGDDDNQQAQTAEKAESESSVEEAASETEDDGQEKQTTHEVAD